MIRLAAVLAVGVLLTSGVSAAGEYADLFRQAAVHTQNGDYEQAIKDYKAALALRPGAPEALNNLAVVFYQLHRYDDAFDYASKIWKTHPELKSAALVAGMAAVQCNRPKAALEPLQQLLGTDPNNRDALLALASAYVGLDELPQAVHTYERETGAMPNDVTGWYGLAICYERMAEASSAKLAHIPGGQSYSKLLLAQYLQGAGDDKLAAEAFGEARAAAATNSREANQEYERARALAHKSQQAFERVVALAPDSWQSAVFLGDVARQHGDLQSAIKHYQDALGQQTDNPAPLLGLGTAYWELGQFDQAKLYLRRTLERNPNAMQAVFEVANIAVRRHEEAEAIPLLKQYLAGQPDAFAARADLGRAYLHTREYDKAVEELRKAAANDDRGEIHYELSIALRKLGRTSEADEALRESTSLRQAQLEREQRRHLE